MPNALRDVPTFVVLLVAGACAALMLLGGVNPADAQAGCKYSHAKPEDLNDKEAKQAISCLVNKERNQRGRGDFSSDGRLSDAADKHSDVMAKKSCFSHQCPGERSLLGRLQSVNYIVGGLTRWAYGENIASGEDGRGSPRSIVNSWMNSSAHRAGILSGTFKEMGVGYASRGDRGYFTTDFGLRRG